MEELRDPGRFVPRIGAAPTAAPYLFSDGVCT